MSADGSPASRESSRAPSGRYVVAGSAVVLAAVFVGIALARGKVADAVTSAVVFLGYALLLVALGGRSESVALLAGRHMDERRRHIDVYASTVTARLLSVVLVGGYLVQLARGASTHPWQELCAAFGVIYIAALLWGRRRL